MKINLPKSIKTKFILSLTVTTGLAMIIVLSTIFIAATRLGQEGQYEDYKAFTDEQANATNQILVNSRLIAEKISTRTEIKKYLGLDPGYTQEDITRILSNYNLGSGYYAIYLLNLEGIATASTDIRFLDQNYSYRYYYEQATKGYPATEVAIGATSKKLGIYFSVPVYNDSSEIVGIVVVKQNPDLIEKSIAYNPLSDELDTLIVDNNGVVIISDNPELLYKSIGQLTASETETITERKTYEGVFVDSMGYAYIKSELPKTNTIEPFLIDSKDELATGIKLEAENLYLINIIQKDSIKDTAKQIASILSIIFIVFMGTNICVIYLIARKLTTPIQQLKDATQDIINGDYNLKLNENINDELGDLIRAFKNMAKKLETKEKELTDSKVGLEKMIENKTSKLQGYVKELEEINSSLLGREKKITELKEKLEKCMQ